MSTNNRDREVRQNNTGTTVRKCLECGDKTIFGVLCDRCRVENHENCREMTQDEVEAAKCTCFLSMCACPVHDPGRIR